MALKFDDDVQRAAWELKALAMAEGQKRKEEEAYRARLGIDPLAPPREPDRRNFPKPVPDEQLVPWREEAPIVPYGGWHNVRAVPIEPALRGALPPHYVVYGEAAVTYTFGSSGLTEVVGPVVRDDYNI